MRPSLVFQKWLENWWGGGESIGNEKRGKQKQKDASKGKGKTKPGLPPSQCVTSPTHAALSPSHVAVVEPVMAAPAAGLAEDGAGAALAADEDGDWAAAGAAGAEVDC